MSQTCTRPQYDQLMSWKPGSARPGPARPGRLGAAVACFRSRLHRPVRQPAASCSHRAVRCGAVRCGAVRCGGAERDTAGAARRGAVRCGQLSRPSLTTARCTAGHRAVSSHLAPNFTVPDSGQWAMRRPQTLAGSCKAAGGAGWGGVGTAQPCTALHSYPRATGSHPALPPSPSPPLIQLIAVVSRRSAR